MPYTLSMAFLWVALAVLLGIVVGWLMRSVVANRQIERARSNHVDTVELERLRGRVANLEPVLAERDRLRTELDERRAATPVAAVPVPEPTPEPAVADLSPSAASESEPDEADLAAAVAVLGRAIRTDDLTVVEGIGPKIADLCHGIGIQTWAELARTEVSLLRTMLHDAGPRFRTHDPGTWPEQARLLAAGRWQDFRELTERLEGGRAVD